jgi:hypothetical protein
MDSLLVYGLPMNHYPSGNSGAVAFRKVALEQDQYSISFNFFNLFERSFQTQPGFSSNKN